MEYDKELDKLRELLEMNLITEDEFKERKRETGKKYGKETEENQNTKDNGKGNLENTTEEAIEPQLEWGIDQEFPHHLLLDKYLEKNVTHAESKTIRFFKKEEVPFGVLSPLSPHGFNLGEIQYKTAQHCFEANKFLDDKYHSLIVDTPTGEDASKKSGLLTFI